MPPERAICSTVACTSGGIAAPLLARYCVMASTAPLRICFAIQVHARHAGLRGERNELHFVRAQFAAAQAVTFFGQHDNRAAFGSFVGQRRKLGGVGQFRFAHARSRNEFAPPGDCPE